MAAVAAELGLSAGDPYSVGLFYAGLAFHGGHRGTIVVHGLTSSPLTRRLGYEAPRD